MYTYVLYVYIYVIIPIRLYCMGASSQEKRKLSLLRTSRYRPLKHLQTSPIHTYTLHKHTGTEMSVHVYACTCMRLRRRRAWSSVDYVPSGDLPR